MNSVGQTFKILTALLVSLAAVVAHAAVTLTDNGTTVTLANGSVTAIIQKDIAQITSMKLGSLETVSGNVYYSMDGGTSYQNPGPCVYSVASQTADLVDLKFLQVWTTQVHPVDIEVHYVMQSGVSGVYTYAILNHPASYPALSIGEWRTVWKHPNDGTNFSFENIYVDDVRHYQGPSYYDVAHASPTSISEVAYLNTGVRAGTYFGKYDFNAEYYKIGTWGHASNANHAGVWMVLGGYDFLNDGPPKQDLTVAEGYTLVHYGRNHYNGSSTNVSAGEDWSKIYGPGLLYLNSCPTGADSCWADAKNRVQAEKTAWPYSWLSHSLYPPASGRGTVTGRFIASDRLKPAVSGAGAWVGLAQPDAGGNWQLESKRYQYWATADSQGNFTITNVRPGTYTLYAFVSGAVGEYSQTNITVSAAGSTMLGNVTWNVYHPGNSIAWEIGIPDRSAAEFRNGGNYSAFLYDTTFTFQFPNPLSYTVGTSNWATDWNYAQSGYGPGDPFNYDPSIYVNWPWNIKFNLSSLPSGNATLTIQLASAQATSLQVFVNDPNMANAPLGAFAASVSGGNALVREARHASYPSAIYVSIPASRLQVGSNTITLLQTGGSTDIANHVMYDYLDLETP